jgi:hypothetical protein
MVGLHLRTQVLGKTRLALAHPQNHWWHTTLYLTARGLTTAVMPHANGPLEIELDFIDHLLIARTDAAVETLPLQAGSTAHFYHEYRRVLAALRRDVTLWTMPVEIPDPIRFTEDQRKLSYDRDAVASFFVGLVEADDMLKAFRTDFLGKCSPSHFWWGSFVLACTRFSGRRAPPHPGGIPNLSDRVTREAYSHECYSAGWWPGTPGGLIQEPSFYAYAYPEPTGCATAPVRPGVARYEMTMREWVLPHQAAAAMPDARAGVAEFLQHTYDTVARLGAWSKELTRSQTVT